MRLLVTLLIVLICLLLIVKRTQFADKLFIQVQAIRAYQDEWIKIAGGNNADIQ